MCVSNTKRLSFAHWRQIQWPIMLNTLIQSFPKSQNGCTRTLSMQKSRAHRKQLSRLSLFKCVLTALFFSLSFDICFLYIRNSSKGAWMDICDLCQELMLDHRLPVIRFTFGNFHPLSTKHWQELLQIFCWLMDCQRLLLNRLAFCNWWRSQSPDFSHLLVHIFSRCAVYYSFSLFCAILFFISDVLSSPLWTSESRAEKTPPRLPSWSQYPYLQW